MKLHIVIIRPVDVRQLLLLLQWTLISRTIHFGNRSLGTIIWVECGVVIVSVWYNRGFCAPPETIDGINCFRNSLWERFPNWDQRRSRRRNETIMWLGNATEWKFRTTTTCCNDNNTSIQINVLRTRRVKCVWFSPKFVESYPIGNGDPSTYVFYLLI